MGFFDDVTSAANRGADAMRRSQRSSQLNRQLSELMKQRRDLAAQLGASLYETVKKDETLRVGREPLIDGIASIDQQREAIEAEIAQIEAAAAASQVASKVYRCPKCGTGVGGDDLFCSGCGLPIAEVLAACTVPPTPSMTPPIVAGPACPSCGAPMAAGDHFCMSCGARVAPAETNQQADTPPLPSSS